MLDPRAEVKGFLAQYVDAFLACDGARIAALYNVPCVTVRADGSIHAFVARVEWEMRRDDGSAIRHWRQSYNFMAAEGGLRILASTFHL